ncbi:unnamed protein product [Rotaria magnacalcarata]|nr:unnamed protein product [Rotaria magnacalcarata]CAF3978534.1 unnamed protein product [Rotaria magnacalcarata]
MSKNFKEYRKYIQTKEFGKIRNRPFAFTPGSAGDVTVESGVRATVSGIIGGTPGAAVGGGIGAVTEYLLGTGIGDEYSIK